MQKILAFETSCDDTAVAIVDATGSVLGEAIFSQIKEHAPFGGVVPEVGSRAHIEQIWHVTNRAFENASLKPKDIDVVAATFAPGLLGPLLVGAQFAKGFALANHLPLIAVHHIEGHIFSGLGEDFLNPPFLALIASGGHTAIYSCDENYQIKVVGETLDDAAGEAFDKIGRALGLGYPAGKIMDDLAKQGDKSAYAFPIAMRKSPGFDFSFSGLKTRALEAIKNKASFNEKDLADFCASFQEAVATALSERAIKACLELKVSSLVLGGGVSANSRIRDLLTKNCQGQIKLYLPPKAYCTDNAVMIAKAAIIRLKQGRFSSLSLDAQANLPIEKSGLLTS